MFGGPFYSAGAARVINGVTYHYKRVSYAYWAKYYGAVSHYVVSRDRRAIARVQTDEELQALFDRIAAGETILPLSERKRLVAQQARNERAAARAARLASRQPDGVQLELGGVSEGRT